MSVIVCYRNCWPCMTGQHPGGSHGWANLEDVEHAAATGQPDPSGQPCGCACVDEEPADLAPETTDFPCPSCGTWYRDVGGFGVIACDVCGWCSHPTMTGYRCDACGRIPEDDR